MQRMAALVHPLYCYSEQLLFKRGTTVQCGTARNPPYVAISRSCRRSTPRYSKQRPIGEEQQHNLLASSAFQMERRFTLVHRFVTPL